MNQSNQQLEDYIRQNLERGVSIESIRQSLVQSNWDAVAVDSALLSVTGRSSSGGASQSIYPEPISSTVNQFQPQESIELNINKDQKYLLSTAINDALAAFSANKLSIIVGTVLVYVLGIGIFLLVSLFAGALTAFDEIGIFSSPTSILTSIIIFVLVYLIFYALFSAMLLSVVAIGFERGAHKKSIGVGSLMASAFRLMFRVALAQAMVSLLVLLPYGLFVFAPFIIMGTEVGSLATAVLPIILALVGLVLVVMALLRFTLVPFVVIFESNLPVTKTLGRSKNLLLQGGQWFLVKGALFLMLMGLLLGFLNELLVEGLGFIGAFIYLLAVFALGIFTSGVLTMLYLNRKAVKG